MWGIPNRRAGRQARSFPLRDNLRYRSLDDAAARSRSLRDSTAVTTGRMIGRALISSSPRNLRVWVIHTPCSGASSVISYSMRSLPRAGVAGFCALAVADDDELRRTQVDVNDRRGRMQGDSDHLNAIEERSDRAHVLVQRVEHRWVVSQDTVVVPSGGDCEERWDCGREGAVDALVAHDDPGAHIEPAR